MGVRGGGACTPCYPAAGLLALSGSRAAAVRVSDCLGGGNVEAELLGASAGRRRRAPSGPDVVRMKEMARTTFAALQFRAPSGQVISL